MIKEHQMWYCDDAVSRTYADRWCEAAGGGPLRAATQMYDMSHTQTTVTESMPHIIGEIKGQRQRTKKSTINEWTWREKKKMDIQLSIRHGIHLLCHHIWSSFIMYMYIRLHVSVLGLRSQPPASSARLPEKVSHTHRIIAIATTTSICFSLQPDLIPSLYTYLTRGQPTPETREHAC